MYSFFDALESQRVESFVVLDGAYDKSDKKLETKKKRAKDKIVTSERLFKNERSPDANSQPDFILPLLAKLVFVQALRDRRIKFAVSDW